MMIRHKAALAAAVFSVLLACSTSQAGLADGYEMQSLPVQVEGQFTAHNGQLHYWTAAEGYRIYDIAGGTTTTIGLPPNGTNTNGFGDAFGVLDKANDLFYAATVYGWSDGDVYVYDLGSSSWQTPGKNGIRMMNAYGGQVHNGQLYVSGLAEPWNGGYGQDTYIFAFDHSAEVGGAAPRHDTLIKTEGNSANVGGVVAVAPNGDVYYGTFMGAIQLYRWTAAQVAGVTEDLYATGATDSFLTLADAEIVLNLPGAGNGVAVDEAGNVFFAVNGFDAQYNAFHILAMVDATAPNGYREIYSSDGYMDWFGPISVDGDFLNGGTLYFSPGTYGGDLLAFTATAVPEPATMVLLGLGGAAVALRRRRR